MNKVQKNYSEISEDKFEKRQHGYGCEKET